MLLTCAHLCNSKNLICGYKNNFLLLLAPSLNPLFPRFLAQILNIVVAV